MAFSINTFVSALNKYDGLSRNAFFEVIISGADEYGGVSRDLKFFCKSVTVPGLNINSISYRPNNIELPQSMPMFMNKDELDCVFLLDGKNEIMKFFHAWMKNVINYSADNIIPIDQNGNVIDAFSPEDTSSSVASTLSYELNYKSDYAKTMQIIVYPKDTDRKYIYRLKDVFPTQINPVTYSWEENNTVATLPVNFSYSSIEMLEGIEGVETSLTNT